MQRFVLAVVFAAILAAVFAYVLRVAARALERADISGAVAQRSSMQKVAFFLLMCLIVYVSLSGAG